MYGGLRVLGTESEGERVWVACRRSTSDLEEGVVRTEESPDENEPPSIGRHAAPEGAPRHPAIDLSRDPHPGKPDHAKPDDE